MMMDIAITVTAQPDAQDSELESLVGMWNAPISVEIISPATFSKGPITETRADLPQFSYRYDYEVKKLG